MSREYDVILLGSGPAASRIVEACAETMRVAIVDSRPIGGTCALRGCNPKKVLVRAAELADWARRSNGQLVTSGDLRIDWPQLIRFMRTFTEPVTPSTQEKYDKLGVDRYDGEARFDGPRSVTVDGQRLRGSKIVVCSGAAPAPLKIPGESHLTLSDEFLELEQLPARIAFIGGGYISLEFAHVACRAGAEVRVIDRNPRPLASFDPDLVDALVEASRKLGITFHDRSEAAGIEPNDGELRLKVRRGDEEMEFAADAVVHGAGRVPAVGSLDLDQAGVEWGDDGIRVDEHLQSVSNPHVYAAGDVADTGQPRLTPVANAEGRAIARTLLTGEPAAVEYGPVPRVAYTVPGLARVGLTEEEADAQGLAYRVEQDDMSDWGSQRKVGGPPAAYKVLLEARTGKLLGAHLLSVQAAETINLFALAMKFGHTADDIKSVLLAFPSFASDIRSML